MTATNGAGTFILLEIKIISSSINHDEGKVSRNPLFDEGCGEAGSPRPGRYVPVYILCRLALHRTSAYTSVDYSR